MTWRVSACGLVLLVACSSSPAGPLDAAAEASVDSAAPTDSGSADSTIDDASVSDSSEAGLDPYLADAVGVPEHWMEDVTETAGIAFDRIPAAAFSNYGDRVGGGVCVLDLDHRPPMDLFFALRPYDGGGSRLYVSDGPMHFADETSTRGLSDVGDAMGCLAFDADGDGDDDLLVTGIGSLRLFLADHGVFVDASASLPTLDPLSAFASAAAGDLDRDGDLDLVVAGYLKYDPGSFVLDCVSCGLVPVPDLLLLRRADGSYEDVTAGLSVDLSFPEPTLALQILDLDQDGDMDVLEGNDFGHRYPNRALLQQPDGTFRDEALALGLDRNRRGYRGDSMGLATGDLNRDGDPDHVFTSFEGDATGVFMCNSSGTCVDRALETGTVVLAGTFRWGPALVDLDLDGWLDLVEATGSVFTDSEIADLGLEGPMDQFPNLMASNGDGTLRPIAPTPDDGRAVRRSLRGIAVTDLDEDGQPDLVFAPAIGSALLLRTVRPPVGHYLRVTLRGRAPNTGAVGATVTVHAGTSQLMRQRLVGEGYLGNFDPRLFFGITEPGPVSVDVRWPDSTTTTIVGVALDGDVTITQP